MKPVDPFRVQAAFLWHMHQPYYRDPVTGRSSMPWVRLHAVKDYQPMALMMARFPSMRLTVNFVPSLIKQILEYTDEGLSDDHLAATLKTAADLNAADRIFILSSFFMVNWNLSLKNSARYGELLDKRGYSPTRRELERAAVLFSNQDMLDLQICFNLAWFHPIHFETDSDLAAIARKGRRFTEEDKTYIISRQTAIMKEVIPRYRELAQSGQIELSTSPFYHPILPLLIDQSSAKEAMPEIMLPQPAFGHHQDALTQLSRAVAYHDRIFGSPPKGLWPSEGSVSEAMLSMVMDQGFSWMATDEDILYRSLGLDKKHYPPSDEERCEFLYHSYAVERNGRKLAMVFRDHYLSDAIGFTYSRWENEAAVADLVGRLENVSSRCRRRQPLVSIILDGENPWEYYHQQGYHFLSRLYDAVCKSSKIEPVTISQALAAQPAEGRISRLFAGSWISHNFKIWIGHAEDRRAWELLAKTRAVLDSCDPAHPGYYRALEEILIAEGSDWCWWYGEENNSGNDEAFDELYRAHLRNVFLLLGREVPDELKVTILSGRRVMVPITKIYSFINPVIDGRVSSYFEWLAAGEYPIEQRGVTMHRAERLLRAIFFGFNVGTLFIRIDPIFKMSNGEAENYTFHIHFLRPRQLRFDVSFPYGGAPRISVRGGQENGDIEAPDAVAAAGKDIVEVAVPFEMLRARSGDGVDFFVSLSKNELEAGHWPDQGYLSLLVPASNFEDTIWSI